MASGTPQKFTIDGIPYRLAGDVNVSLTPDTFENDLIPTTGEPMEKKVKRIAQAESVTLIVDWAEVVVLRASSESFGNKKFSFTWAGGDVTKSEGIFSMEPYESEEGRLPITIKPAGAWDIFPA
jgi:hypothetical protein